MGKLDSITKINGANVKDSVSDASEKILSLRNVEVSGPWYTLGSLLVVDVDVDWVFVSAVDAAVPSARDILVEEKVLVGMERRRALK